MMLYYREDLFEKYGLAGAEDLGRVRRGRPHRAARRTPRPTSARSPARTPAGSPGWPSRPAPSGGRSAATRGRSSINDERHQEGRRLLGRPGQGGRHRRQPMSPPSGTRRSTTARCSTWPSRGVGARACCPSNAPKAKGKWAIAPLPQWNAGRELHRQLGRLLHRRSPPSRRTRPPPRSSPPGSTPTRRRSTCWSRRAASTRPPPRRQAAARRGARLLLQPARLLAAGRDDLGAARAASPSARTSTSPTTPSRTPSTRRSQDEYVVLRRRPGHAGGHRRRHAEGRLHSSRR